MPKFSTSPRHVSHQDGKKKSKRRGHQYREAAKARKLRQTRIKGIVEEVVEPVEPGKARPLRRSPKYDLAKIERKLRAKCEESQPVDTPTVPAEVYGLNSVNFNVPRVIVPTSEATAKRKQAAAGDDDGDTTDVDDSEDVIVVPAGFVEAAENLGLLNGPAASSGPREELEDLASASHAQPDENPSVAERISTKIETPSSPRAVSETNSSAPSPPLSSPTQRSQVVPELEVVYNDGQTITATSSSTYLKPFEPSAPILVPQAASVSESFQEALWFYQQDTQNAFYLGSTDDINMELSGAATMKTPAHSLPTMRTPSQPQPEHQTFCSYVSQVANNNNHYQTYTIDNIRLNWASIFQPVQNESIQQSAQINQQPFNHAVDPLTAAFCFWTALSENPVTSQSPTTIPEIIKSTPNQSNEQRPQEEPSKLFLFNEPISYQDIRRYRPDDDGGFQPFPNLRGCRNMIYINMSGALDESRIIQPMPSYRRLKPPVSSEMDLINHLRTEAKGQAAPHMSKVEHRKWRCKDSQPGFACISQSDFEVPLRQRRHCEPDASKMKTPVPVQKRSHKLHWQRGTSSKGPGPTSSRTPTGWNFSRFCPTISSLTDRLFKLFQHPQSDIHP